MIPFGAVLAPGEVLAPVREADVPELFAVVDRERARLREWLPWVDSTRTEADTRDFVDAALRLRAENDMLTCTLRWRGRLVGVVAHHRIDWPNRATKLGYWLAEEATGRGMMTRAVAAMVGHSFDRLGLHRLEIRAATGNHRSQAIPRRLGFWHEGTARDAEWLYDHWVDLEVFAMTEPVWAELRLREGP